MQDPGAHVHAVAQCELDPVERISEGPISRSTRPERTASTSSLYSWYCRLRDCPARTWSSLPEKLPGTSAKIIS